MSQDKENLVEGTEVEETTLDDIFEATFGQRVDMRQARELKRMKMRHARQDAAAKVKEIQSEAKLDPVNHAELKGSHADRKDKDINNDGKSDKTDEYLHKRRKAVKKAIANKPIKLTPGWGDGGKSMKSSYGKLAKEEVEQIDEISADMAYRYLRGRRKRDYDISPDGKSAKSKKSMTFDQMIKKGNSTTRALRTIEKEKKGILNREEAEQIDEISGKTLASYSDKVARYGPMKDVRTRQKHEKGIYTAYKKMKAKDVKVPARMEEADVPFEGPYRKTGERKDEYGNTVKNVAKHLAKKAMKKQMGGLKKEEAEQIEESLDLSMRNAGPMKSIFGKSSSEKKSQEDRAKRLKKKVYGNMMGGLKKEEAEQIDELSKATLGSYVKKAKKELSSSDYHVGRAVGAREAGQSANFSKGLEQKLAAKGKKRYHGIDKAVDKLTKEEVENIDELSRATVGRYSQKAKSIADNEGGKDRTKGRELAGRKRWGGTMSGVKKAKVMATEEAEQIDEISAKTIDRYREQSHRKEYPGPKGSKKYEKRARGSIMAFNKLTGRAKVPARMEEAEIIEARGRPRKDAQKDYTIHPKTKEKLMHNNPAHMKRIEALHRTGALQKPKVEAGQNIITQLRKASTSMRGGEKVNFNYGASTHVSAAHAQKILDKHASMRPAEKEKFQKDIGHSHAMLKKHV